MTRILRFAAPVLVAVTVAAACSSSKSSSTSPGTTAATGQSATLSGTLNGSGSTFQAAYNQVVIQAFQQAHSGVTINYQAVGSGTGQTNLANQVSDFAGSDVPETASQLPGNKGGQILYFPTVIGPITVSYNLPGSPKITLSGATLAKIFSRKITNWNDPAIAGDGNGGLPNLPITVVHRSDSSGTTANFTSYLKKDDPTDWTLGSGKTVNWASDTQAGNGNTGVANDIKGKSGAIGYVDYSDAQATGLTWAKIKNKAGNAVDATLDGASASANDATVNSDLTYDPIDPSGAQDYPITSPTYIITYAKYSDAGKVALLKAFLSYILGPDGQKAAQQAGFAPLGQNLDQKALAQVDQITTG